MLSVQTSSVAETQEFAARVASQCQPGDLIVLIGDLGAGKTAFTQGLGRALGVAERITSPTFTLAQRYEGRLTLHHLDVYRIEQLEDSLDLAIPELLEGDTVTVMEWGDRLAPILPANYLELRIVFGAGDDDRTIDIRCVGEAWASRTAPLVGQPC